MVKSLFLKFFNNIWPMLVVFVVVNGLLRYYYLKSHRERFCFYKEVINLVIFIYIWSLFELLTMTELNTTSLTNLVPFSEILRYPVGSKMFYYNVLGNIIIFIPFGYIIGNYVKPKNILPIVITTFITSLTVELLQLKIGRSLDVDDIILNVVGGIIGYLLYIGINAIIRKLPDGLKREWVKNLLCVIAIALFLIYILGYWGVIFK